MTIPSVIEAGKKTLFFELRRPDMTAEPIDYAAVVEAIYLAMQAADPAWVELREALAEARLIVANLPHDESLFLAKIDAALKEPTP